MSRGKAFLPHKFQDPQILQHSEKYRMALVRFSSVMVVARNGSSSSGFQFGRFLCEGILLSFSTISNKSAVSVQKRSVVVPVGLVPGKMVPVSSFSSVPGPF